MRQKENILFITTSYEQNNSSAAVRNIGLVKGLVSLGHEVTVLTVDWPEAIKSSFFTKNNRTPVIRTHLPELSALSITGSGSKKSKARSSDWVKKIRHYLRDLIYFPDVCCRWAKHVSDFDTSKFTCILSSSDFKSSHFAALKLKTRNPEIKWVQIWGDPWASDYNLSKTHYRRVRSAEQKLLEKADRAVYISELTKKHIAECYPRLKDKLEYIPRSYYQEIYKKPSESHEVWNMIYPGILSTGRNILPLLKAIESYNETHRKPFRLNLYGEYSSAGIKEMGTYDFVKIHKSVEFGEIIELLEISDIALFISNDSSSTQIPGKLFDYMGCQLPVLSIVNSRTDSLCDVLRKFNRCIIAENSQSDILRSLEYIGANDTSVYPFDTDYSPETVARRFIDLIQSIKR